MILDTIGTALVITLWVAGFTFLILLLRKIPFERLTSLSMSKKTVRGTAITLVVLLVLFCAWYWRNSWFAETVDWLTIGLIAFAALVLTKGAYDSWKNKSSGAKTAFLTALVALAGFTLLYFTVGERRAGDPLLQDRFDVQTGMPQFMVYKTTDNKVAAGRLNGDLLEPKDCRPEDVPHEGFNYLEEGTCFSPIDNTERMRPILPSDELVGTSLRSVLATGWDLVWGTSKSADVPEDSKVQGCTPSPRQISFPPMQPGDDQEICILRDRTYLLKFGNRQQHDVVVTLDGSVPNGSYWMAQPDEEDLWELIEVERSGYGSSLPTYTMEIRAINSHLWSQFAPNDYLKLEVAYKGGGSGSRKDAGAETRSHTMSSGEAREAIVETCDPVRDASYYEELEGHNCRRVTLPDMGSSFPALSPPDKCIRAYPQSAVRFDEESMSFRPRRQDATFYVFDLAIGENVLRATCG